jgi:STE24 endopeptidase
MPTFTIVFLAALFISISIRLFLAIRHLQHVKKHREAVPAVFSEAVSLQAHQKAADYTQEKGRFGIFEMMLIEVPFLLVLTLGGGLEWIDRASLHWMGDNIWRHIATVFAVMFTSSAISMPFDLYRTFGIEARYGFNRTSFSLWLIDLIKGTLLGLAIGTPLLLAIIWFYSAAGAGWWVYAWLMWTAFILLMMWAYPKFLAPIFNKFTPLGNGEREAEVRTKLEAMLSQEGFASDGLFVMDGSKRSGHGNAYFTGLGKNKRIVFFDTLLTQLSANEIEAVLAHELGHFKRGHVPRMIIVQQVMAFIFLGLLGFLVVQPWFYTGLGVHATSNYSPGIGAALILFSFVSGYFTLPFKPLASIMSRKHEFEADEFAAQRTGAAPLISALTKLYSDNAATLTPDPLYSLMYDSHPPPSIRILQLNTQFNPITSTTP